MNQIIPPPHEATPTTLFVVPYLFAVLRKRNDGKPAQGVFAEDPQ